MTQPAPVTANEFSVGSLFVVEDKSSLSADRSHATVFIQSRVNRAPFGLAIEELGSTAARRLAQSFAAARGVATPSINGNNVGPYPVNDDGIPLDQIADATGKPLDPQHAKMQPAAYRVEIPIAAKLL